MLAATFGLIFVAPKVFFSLEQGGKKMFWVSFVLSFGDTMLLLFSKKKKEAPPEKLEKSATSSLSYQ